MPRLSDTMERGTIARWLVHEGDPVHEGDVLAEIETDKATMELNAYNEGVLLRILVQDGESADLGAPIAVDRRGGRGCLGLLRPPAGHGCCDGGGDERGRAGPRARPPWRRRAPRGGHAATRRRRRACSAREGDAGHRRSQGQPRRAPHRLRRRFRPARPGRQGQWPRRPHRARRRRARASPAERACQGRGGCRAGGAGAGSRRRARRRRRPRPTPSSSRARCCAPSRAA